MQLSWTDDIDWIHGCNNKNCWICDGKSYQNSLQTLRQNFKVKSFAKKRKHINRTYRTCWKSGKIYQNIRGFRAEECSLFSPLHAGGLVRPTCFIVTSWIIESIEIKIICIKAFSKNRSKSLLDGSWSVIVLCLQPLWSCLVLYIISYEIN